MPGSKRAALVLLATLPVAFGARLSAHRLDEFLQATRIAVERDRVELEMSLTPGSAVADRVLGEIDADRNGMLSHEEQQAYAGRVLTALTLRVDEGQLLRMQLAGSSFPDVAALRAGDAAITIRAEAEVSALTVGPHRLLFRNRNAPTNSVYLANALVPDDDRVEVTKQLRDGDQSELTIEFEVRDDSLSGGAWASIGLAGLFTLAAALTRRTSK